MRNRATALIVLTLAAAFGCSSGLTPGNQATVTKAEKAEAVLKETAERVCPSPSTLRFSETGYSFNCEPAPGHDTRVKMEPFASEAEARAAMEKRCQGDSEDFYGFPLCKWGEDYPSFPGGREEYEIWLWQGGQWVVEVRAFDDTHFLIAPRPETVSEELYEVGTEHGLFSEEDG